MHIAAKFKEELQSIFKKYESMLREMDPKFSSVKHIGNIIVLGKPLKFLAKVDLIERGVFKIKPIDRSFPVTDIQNFFSSAYSAATAIDSGSLELSTRGASQEVLEKFKVSYVSHVKMSYDKSVKGLREAYKSNMKTDDKKAIKEVDGITKKVNSTFQAIVKKLIN